MQANADDKVFEDSWIWGDTVVMAKEPRPMQPVQEILVKGSLDVVIVASTEPRMVVAADAREEIPRVKTRFEGDRLVIEQEGISISQGRSNIAVSGSGNIVAGRSIIINVNGTGIDIQGEQGNVVVNSGKAVVAIAQLIAPNVTLTGSGDVELLGLKQHSIELLLKGSGDISAVGEVVQLIAELKGSGDLDLSALKAEAASLQVKGSGDIKAYARQAVDAKVSGSGDIVVLGHPAERSQVILGSGSIQFK